jgi:hypothetical protein
MAQRPNFTNTFSISSSAAQHMGRSKDDLRESVLKPLYQLAHRAYLEDRCILTEKDLERDLGEALCTSGFLWMEVSVTKRFDSQQTEAVLTHDLPTALVEADLLYISISSKPLRFL